MTMQSGDEDTGVRDQSEVLNGRRPASDARLLEAVRNAAPMKQNAGDVSSTSGPSGKQDQHIVREIDEPASVETSRTRAESGVRKSTRDERRQIT